MKKLCLLALALLPAWPQIVQQDVRVEKFEIHGDGTPGPEPVLAGMIGPDGRMGVLNVVGKPFSATETRHTVQMLANGTKIETSDTNQLYRDDQGRERIEQTLSNRTVIVIMDPVAHFVAILDPASKTAHKNPIPAGAVNGAVSVDRGQVMVRLGNVRGGPKDGVTSLGDKDVNGVTATGTRETRAIPPGAIGNDHELAVVNEHWYSSDLQVLIKSVNSDPRFGETTYQLTNIVRTMQDSALFQIPQDYTIKTGRLP